MIHFAICGLICGAFYGVTKGIKYILKNQIVAILCDFLATILSGACIIIITTFNCGGIFRFHYLGIFAISMLIERKTIGKLFAFISLLFYNWIVKNIKNFKKTKLGNLLFK